MRLGVIPTLNLPVKSHQAARSTERRHINLVKDVATKEDEIKKPEYKNFQEFSKRVEKLKLHQWNINFLDETVIFKHTQKPFVSSKLEVIVDKSLNFTCIVYGWSLPNNSELYNRHSRSLKNITISLLLQEILSYDICNGVENIDSPNLLLHTISHEMDFNQIIDGSPPVVKRYNRSPNCFVWTFKNLKQCQSCQIFTKKHLQNEKIKNKCIETPARPNAPLKVTHPNRVRLALKNERLITNDLRKQVERMQKELSTKSVKIDDNLKEDIDTVMESNVESMTPFMKLFWNEQKKAASCRPTAVRYHPMVIRFCLSLCMKSASAYDELRSSNVLTLPSHRTLRDYKNAIKPSAGFNPEVIEELIKTTSSLKDHQRFVVLSFDEVKIQADLVFDKHSGNLIGYVDLGDPELNYSSFNDVNDLATHAFVYYVRGLSSDLKYALAYFGTQNVHAKQLFKTFWEAVLVLEVICELPVVACVSDGASPNRKFYKMHKFMDYCVDEDIVYRTINIYAPERFIWFFADAPHLMKTLRNCIFHSSI